MLKKRGGKKGFKMSKEQKRQISEKLKGVKKSEKTRERMKLAQTGTKKSDETRRKMSENKKEQWQDEIYRQKLSKKLSIVLKEKGFLVNKYGENHPAWKGGPEKRECFICGKIFEVYSIINKGIYCSKSCAAKSRIGERSAGWKNGASFEPYCSKFNKRKKEEIRNRYNRVCVVSGISVLQNGRRLDVDHIDENKQQGCNEMPFKLIPLSHKVHAKMSNKQNHYLLELLLYGNKKAELNYEF